LCLRWKGKEREREEIPIQSRMSQGGKKKDLSKIKCFHCHELGHYAMKCPHKKEERRPQEEQQVKLLASQFELDFTLIACMESTSDG
jgi:hypothetical protein